MKKILGIIVLLIVCGIVAFFVTRKSDYAYVESLLATDGSDAFHVVRQDDKIVNYTVAFKNPARRLINIASKSPDGVFDYDFGNDFDVQYHGGYVLVSVLPDDVLQGEAAERGCNYKVLYLPKDKDNAHVFDKGNINSVIVCKKN